MTIATIALVALVITIRMRSVGMGGGMVGVEQTRDQAYLRHSPDAPDRPHDRTPTGDGGASLLPSRIDVSVQISQTDEVDGSIRLSVLRDTVLPTAAPVVRLASVVEASFDAATACTIDLPPGDYRLCAASPGNRHYGEAIIAIGGTGQSRAVRLELPPTRPIRVQLVGAAADGVDRLFVSAPCASLSVESSRLAGEAEMMVWGPVGRAAGVLALDRHGCLVGSAVVQPGEGTSTIACEGSCNALSMPAADGALDAAATRAVAWVPVAGPIDVAVIARGAIPGAERAAIDTWQFYELRGSGWCRLGGVGPRPSGWADRSAAGAAVHDVPPEFAEDEPYEVFETVGRSGDERWIGVATGQGRPPLAGDGAPGRTVFHGARGYVRSMPAAALGQWQLDAPGAIVEGIGEEVGHFVRVADEAGVVTTPLPPGRSGVVVNIPDEEGRPIPRVATMHVGGGCGVWDIATEPPHAGKLSVNVVGVPNEIACSTGLVAPLGASFLPAPDEDRLAALERQRFTVALVPARREAVAALRLSDVSTALIPFEFEYEAAAQRLSIRLPAGGVRVEDDGERERIDVHVLRRDRWVPLASGAAASEARELRLLPGEYVVVSWFADGAVFLNRIDVSGSVVDVPARAGTACRRASAMIRVADGVYAREGHILVDSAEMSRRPFAFAVAGDATARVPLVGETVHLRAELRGGTGPLLEVSTAGIDTGQVIDVDAY